jgi:hypothetical protein
MNDLNELREQGRMTWIEQEHGWLAAPQEILNALSNDGFEECKREMTTSRRDRRPAGGVWQGVNTRTGSEASAIWVNRPVWHQAIVFIDIDGESLVGAHSLAPRLERDPYEEEGRAVSGATVSSSEIT